MERGRKLTAASPHRPPRHRAEAVRRHRPWPRDEGLRAAVSAAADLLVGQPSGARPGPGSKVTWTDTLAGPLGSGEAVGNLLDISGTQTPPLWRGVLESPSSATSGAGTG